MFNEHDLVYDLTESNLGKGVIVDIYTNRHDDPNGVTIYCIEFEGCEVFDRLAHEIRPYESEEEVDDKRDAERWRALIGSARIRVMGSAGFKEGGIPRDDNDGYLHMGVEFWSKHSEPSNEISITTLVNYADFLRNNK